MEEISMDLAENIGATRGYNHLLIVQCNFSDFLTIYPLKSKTNTEISRVLRDGIFQVFTHLSNKTSFFDKVKYKQNKK